MPCGCLGQEPAFSKPAASASAADLNQNSAWVWSYHWPSGSWNLPESALPLTVYSASGEEPSSFAAMAPAGTSLAAASVVSLDSVDSVASVASVASSTLASSSAALVSAAACLASACLAERLVA